MILRRLDPAQSPNGNGSRWPKAHRVRCGSNSAIGVTDRPCSADRQLPELVRRIFAMDTISQFGQKRTSIRHPRRLPDVTVIFQLLQHEVRQVAA